MTLLPERVLQRWIVCGIELRLSIATPPPKANESFRKVLPMTDGPVSYSRTIRVNGHELRIRIDGTTNKVDYDGREISRKVGWKRLVAFTVEEDGARALYGVGIVRTDRLRIYVARNGMPVCLKDPAD